MTEILLIILILLVVTLIVLFLLNKKPLDTAQIVSSLSSELKAASVDALSKQAELGGRELDEKKKLIDQRLDAIKQELDKVEASVKNFSDQSAQKMTSVDTRVTEAARVISELKATTNKLNEILSSSAKRGEWGQRSAKQILDLCGMTEGLNYTQQETLDTGRPDFTFNLPNGIKLNLDCKFPLDNYAAYVKSENASEKENLKKAFIKDVKAAVTGLTKRNYITPETVDYCVMFIANEQVFNFVNEAEPEFMDFALKSKVVVCSPFTLFAVVSVIFKAVESYKMEKASKEIIGLIGKFNVQWNEFKTQFETVGKALDKAKEEYNNLTTTRANKLEVPLREIDKLSGKTE